jgi:hypothetical protein
VNDDWRVQVDFHEEGDARALTERLDAQQLEHDLSDAFHDRVVVSRDGARVFLYAGTRDQAEGAGTRSRPTHAGTDGPSRSTCATGIPRPRTGRTPTSRCPKTTPPSSPSTRH